MLLAIFVVILHVIVLVLITSRIKRLIRNLMVKVLFHCSFANSLNFRGSLDEGYAGDLLFADALEAFGAGRDDPVSVAIGGYLTNP
jgi:hypothetical protein